MALPRRLRLRAVALIVFLVAGRAFVSPLAGPVRPKFAQWRPPTCAVAANPTEGGGAEGRRVGERARRRPGEGPSKGARKGGSVYSSARRAADRRDRPAARRLIASHAPRQEAFAGLRGGERDALVIAAARTGLLHETQALASWASQLPDPPSVFVYGALVDFYRRRGDLGGCRRVVREMESRGVEATEVVLNTLISALVDKSLAREALELAASMFDQFGCQPTVASYHPVLAAAAAAGESAAATAGRPGLL
mmetsp:Transcript_29188/g.65361  ORF Transcript_29188/g.65361 Transcript_29188/m.65361 type:complete len:252 (+) Transcript_29188:46-801(+)